MRLVRPNIASLRMPTHLLALLAMAVPIKNGRADGTAKNDGRGMLILERPWNDDRRPPVAPPLRGMDGIARVVAKGECNAQRRWEGIHFREDEQPSSVCPSRSPSVRAMPI